MTVKDLDSQPNFAEIEQKMLRYWRENKIVGKYLQKNNNAKKRYFFLDGPITANNPMGVHHAWGRTLKDLYQRFYNMMGYEERFQNGFDCQGLWVEVEVEKELGFKTKKNIEEYGIDKFVNKCKERVEKYSAIQTKQSKRLGYFMDWDNSYYTMGDENNYMIWHFLKVCHERGWLYEGWDSVPWCPRCETAISQHEILTEEYKELEHQSVFVKFPLQPSTESLLIWTTTPWTLAANVAVAVHPELKYSLYKNKDTQERLIFIDDSETSEMLFLGNYLNVQQFTKEKTFLGKELVGLTYRGPFDELEQVQKAKKEKPDRFHTVFVYKELVNANEGTGLVHIAPGCGKEDYDLSLKENIAQISPIDSGGNYVKGFGFLTGKNVRKTNELIFQSLEDKGFLYKIQKYKHRYPTCWRCKEELVFRLVEEWYIAMDRVSRKQRNKGIREQKNNSNVSNSTLRQQMIAVAKKIRWIPDFGLDRELDWLNNMHDWLISKKRYWGLALPFWKCAKCGKVSVIGSREELKKEAIKGWQMFDGHSPHRPWVDEIKIKCSHCGEPMSRIADVGNPWLDAGIVPYSTLVDPQTKRVSYVDDKKYWRKWFPPDLVLECFPGQFKNWFYSLIAMSTVLENTPPYKTLLGFALVKDEHGEEMHKSKGNAIWFDEAAETMGVDVVRWMYCLQPIVQDMKFGYSLADETRRRFHLILWNVYKFFTTYAKVDKWGVKKIDQRKLTLLDRWILERLDQVTYRVTASLKKYQAYVGAYELEQFLLDLSTWYLRRSRKRVGPTASNRKDKEAFYSTLHQVLTVFMRLLAPFIPFLPDYIYQNLTKEESVHLASWPKIDKKDLEDDLSRKMALVREIVVQGHAIRKEGKVRVRQPLPSVTYTTKSARLPGELVELIKDELNVKQVHYIKGRKALDVSLNLKLTPKLKEEGIAREIVRLVQDLRKQLKCQFDDLITLYYSMEKSQPKGKIGAIINKYQKEIKKQVIANQLINQKRNLKYAVEKEIDGEKIWLGIRHGT